MDFTTLVYTLIVWVNLMAGVYELTRNIRASLHISLGAVLFLLAVLSHV